MEISEAQNRSTCPSAEISAYIDGELSGDAELLLEMHLAHCRVCTDDLNLQKSFLNALESSLVAAEEIELPPNFTKSVITNAESGVSGLRRAQERRNAAVICVALAVFAVFAFGSSVDRAIGAVTGAAEKSFAVIGSALHFVYDISLGSAVVFKSLASSLVFGSAAGIFFFLVVLVLS